MLPKCEADMAGLSKKNATLDPPFLCPAYCEQTKARALAACAPLCSYGISEQCGQHCDAPGEAQASESAETAPRVQQSE
tara:strand:- start:26 stop:262 length:237 start_codon:yes stop_codon:yes gene_type:complete